MLFWLQVGLRPIQSGPIGQRFIVIELRPIRLLRFFVPAGQHLIRPHKLPQFLHVLTAILIEIEVVLMA